MVLRLGMALREGDGVEDHVLAVDDPDHPHLVEGDDPLNGGAHTVEDLAELDRLRGDLGDLGENAGNQLSIRGWGCEAHWVPVRVRGLTSWFPFGRKLGPAGSTQISPADNAGGARTASQATTTATCIRS